MPSQIAVSPDIIVEAMLAQLVARGVWTEHQVSVGLEPEPQPVPGSTYGRLDPGAFRPVGDFEGGGRFADPYVGPVVLRVYLRRDVDSNQTDRQAISELYRKAVRAMNALGQFLPTDASSNSLTTEPIRAGAIGKPRRYRKDRQWIYLEVPYEVSFQLEYDQDGLGPGEVF